MGLRLIPCPKEIEMRQFNPIEFTENQEAIATRIEEILSPKAAVDARHVPLAGD